MKPCDGKPKKVGSNVIQNQIGLGDQKRFDLEITWLPPHDSTPMGVEGG